MDSPDWFLKHSKLLRDLVKPISMINPDCSNEYRAHTALKLFCVGYWSQVFSPIMKKIGIPTVYIDLCSGSGLTKVTGSDKFLPGSPFVADAYGNIFDYVICVDNDPQYANVLTKRLSAVRKPDSFKVFCCDNQDAIGEIIEIVKSKRAMFFCFYDPHGFDGFSWNVLEKLASSLNGDLLLTWFEHGLWRNYPHNEIILNRVFGDDSWKGAKSSEELTTKFCVRLSSIRALIKPIEIVDESKTVYHQILCVKETPAGSPFLRAWDDLRGYLESEGARATEMWLDIAYEKQTQLFDPKFER